MADENAPDEITDQDLPDQWEGAKIQAGLNDRRSSRQLWLISYSDFMTILMIFFLSMYGYTYLAKATLLKNSRKKSDSDFVNQIAAVKEKLGNQIKIQSDVDKVIVELNEKILFPSGQATLSKDAKAPLEELAKSLKLIEGDVVVEGHTDNVPIKSGTFKSNWELSAARAFSVTKALVAQGVPPSRLAAWGFGENRPRVPNVDDASRAQNRRIEVVILRKKGKQEAGYGS
ncbi:MAG: hypothetical protein KCHDKBKB_00844 [Elusimicrobia bacterium]|nr:hypothetical protein [Elusimicrobiota bacterium]